MAKAELRIRARTMRQRGESIRDITAQLGVSKASVSRWCGDITLSKSQILRLVHRKEGAIRKGQLLGALTQKRKRQVVVDAHLETGRERFKNLRDVEFFIAGLALYLAEGAKTMRQVHFVNADPRVVLFMMQWLQKFYSKKVDDFAVSVLINESHKSREELVIRFWSRYLSVPRNQFRKTIFVKTLQKKTYENHEQYFGTLRFTVLKSSELYYIISGLMEGLLQHIPKPV